MIKLEIINTGDELLDGRVLNSNLLFLGQYCHTLGLSIQKHTTVPDSAKLLCAVFKERSHHCDWLLVTGGLGPTDDDRTTACVAEAFDLPLVRDDASVSVIEAYYAAKKAHNPKSNLKQAYFPKGAEILSNPLGTAPGFLLDTGTTKIVVMPGVPSEMKEMFLTHVYPKLKIESDSSRLKTVCKTFKCVGVGESALADALESIYPLPDGVELGYRALSTEVHLQLIVRKSSKQECQQVGSKLEIAINKACKTWLYPSSFNTVVHFILDRLQSQHQKLAIAESCTGGLLSSWFTQIPGASTVLEYGVVAYSNLSKTSLLDVPSSLLAQHGEVSEPVAEAMLNGLNKNGVSAAIAITGIAGPDGGTPQKPVGTVCIAVRLGDRQTVKTVYLLGDRQQIQQRAASQALVMLFYLLGTNSSSQLGE